MSAVRVAFGLPGAHFRTTHGDRGAQSAHVANLTVRFRYLHQAIARVLPSVFLPLQVDFPARKCPVPPPVRRRNRVSGIGAAQPARRDSVHHARSGR